MALDPKKPWVKVSKQGFITQIRAAQPGPGVWYRRVDGLDEQSSYEFGAKDGQIIVGRECYHGEDRANAWASIKWLGSGKVKVGA